MAIIKTISERRSVRTFTAQQLPENVVYDLKGYIASLNPVFGEKVRIELLRAGEPGRERVKLGTYGVISGASDFLALICEEKPMSKIAAGYMFEQVVLYCTAHGLGTCWLGGTFKASDFVGNVALASTEKIPIVSPVGYPRDKMTFIESLMRKGAGSDKRNPWSAMFFDKSFGTPLKEENAGAYRQPLEMVRLGPSASNKQPWRVVAQDEKTLHFYYHGAARFAPIDMGIALCHFGETAAELNIPGSFVVLDAGKVPQSDGNTYAASWVAE